MATNNTTTKSRDRTGIGWLVLGIVLMAIYGISAVLVQNPFVDQTHTPLWLGVIVGLVMVIFGVIGMTKRRHPGHY
ncbi:hypothetical protein [Arthrobacter rhombi]|uniref:hypothetical protein n=1 Tax=Arthrobacter rhombi TaxID=71253 RepID=UPI003FD3897D